MKISKILSYSKAFFMARNAIFVATQAIKALLFPITNEYIIELAEQSITPTDLLLTYYKYVLVSFTAIIIIVTAVEVYNSNSGAKEIFI
ncbi:hypothetical protein BDF21DRAFT_408547 [Thamnidium elegans]|nr:hypothetical protein BDF21DRAFT_408547 [Thamnidium elegans]